VRSASDTSLALFDMIIVPPACNDLGTLKLVNNTVLFSYGVFTNEMGGNGSVNIFY
jgi:hypothetical protein